MHNRSESLGVINHFNRHRRAPAAIACASALAVVATLAFFAGRANAQTALPPAMESAPDASAPPMTQSGGGNVDFFSQDLGTIFRLRYNTAGYGQDGTGNFDIGTMKVVTLGDTSAFFDGQVTMNESDGVGFNVGLGYRWMNYPPYAGNSGRMDGISLWADGTHTDAGNFFPQVGISYESLGEKWDVRANGYIPVGEQEQTGSFKSTNQIAFDESSISNITKATTDRSFYSVELEIARRLGDQRDAWGFAGPYFVANDDQDSAGFRAGLRGYAYPDLLLQFAVSDDDVFKTNAMFSVTWFVGRTRTDFQPACGTPDRMREPVMRNDYVVLSHKNQFGGIPLSNPDGTPIVVRHFDNTAPDGGDGTIKNPYNQLTDANGTGSTEGDILFPHSTSIFAGESSVILKKNQRLLGEGNSFLQTVATLEKGTINIPESSPGSRALARPQINGFIGAAVTLADNNEVSNFDIDGQNVTVRAIASPVGGSGNPNLNHLTIKNTTGDAISTTPLTITDTDDLDNDNNVTEQIVRGNVTINTVILDSIGGDGIHINSATTTDVTLPTVTLQEAIAISNVTSTNSLNVPGAGRGINIENTHTGTGHTTTLTSYTYDGGTTGAGGIRLNNFDGAFSATASTLTNGSTTSKGVEIVGDTDGAINFASTVTYNKLGGTAFDINGDVGGNNQIGSTITVAGAITDAAVSSVSVQGLAATGSANFTGNIISDTVTQTGDSIFVNSNATGANIAFIGQLTIKSTGNGFIATDGGTLTASAANNTINVTNGQAAKITGMVIADADVRFSEVNRSVAAATSALQFENNTGTGAIEVGTTTNTAGETGTVEGGAADTVVINNSANVTITGLIVNNAANQRGVHVTKTTTGTQTTNLNDLQINDGSHGIDVTGGGGSAGTLNLTIADTEIKNSTQFGLNFNNVDNGTVRVDNATIDGGPANAAGVGVHIINSNATFTFDTTPATDNTLLQNWGQTDFEVDGGTPNITFNGSIDNTIDNVGRSVIVHNLTGGSVTFSPDSSIKDSNDGLIVDNNTNATIGFLGAHDFDTSGADAVTVTNNKGTTSVIFDGLDINTTTGRGVFIDANASTTSVAITDVDITTTLGDAFTATGAGDLTVSGNNNVIKTTTGRGLVMTGMNIVTEAKFESVTVNGAPTAIALSGVTGAQVTVGESGGATHSGGTLTTTGDAITLTNTTNVDLLHMQIISAGGNGVTINQGSGATTAMDITIDDLDLDVAALNGIQVTANDNDSFAMRLTNSDLEANVDITSTGSGHFGLLVDSTDINTDVTNPSVDAFALNITGAASSDITLRNGNNFTAGDAHALFINANNSGAADSNLLINGTSKFTNTSATFVTADIRSEGGTQMDATIQGNTFANLDAAAAGSFDLRADGAAAGMLLNLGGTGAQKNTATGSGPKYTLSQLNGADFQVFQLNATVTTQTKNNGAVVTVGTLTDSGTTQPTTPIVP